MSVAAIVINLGYAAVSVGLAVAWYRITRRPSEQARAEGARERVGLVPPAPDNQPGINLADHDACELLLDDPAFAARCERLWQAIRNEQHNQKGDQ